MIDPVEFGKAMGQLVRDAVAPLLLRLDALEARQLERGEKGEPGAAGAPGKDAEINMDALAESVARSMLTLDGLKAIVDLSVQESVEEFIKANPAKDGAKGDRGEKGDIGEPGKDGVGLADALIDRDGSLVLTMTDGRAKTLGNIIGKDGAPGANGKDGVSLDGFALEYDGDKHEIVLRCTAAGATKELRFSAGGIRPGGFWRDGMKAYALQAITHDGALWIAKRDTAAKPCMENSEDWQLAARKGRDGRDGKDGKPPPGPVKLGGDGNA